MRLFRRPSPPPPSHWRPFAVTPTSPPPAPHRPLLARFRSAPAHLEQPGSTDYFTFPRRPSHHVPILRRLGSAISERVEDAEDHAEAGCLRLMLRAVRWWAWRRWRTHGT